MGVNQCEFVKFLILIQEWNDFLQDLYDAIEQQLRESHISSLSDLSVSEQKLFVEKATKAIGQGVPFQCSGSSIIKLRYLTKTCQIVI